MKDIIIIGASGLGKEVKIIIDLINRNQATYNFKGYYDDAHENRIKISRDDFCEGNINSLIEKVKTSTSIVFGIANREVVEKIYLRLKTYAHFSFPNIADPNINFTESTKIGFGNVFAQGSLFSCDLRIGNFNFFNSFAAVGHDTEIGDFNSFMPRTQISGGVKIGDYNTFGMSSAIIQNKSIGDRNIINAYTLLTKNIGSQRKYFGIPGKRINI